MLYAFLPSHCRCVCVCITQQGQLLDDGADVVSQSIGLLCDPSVVRHDGRLPAGKERCKHSFTPTRTKHAKTINMWRYSKMVS